MFEVGRPAMDTISECSRDAIPGNHAPGVRDEGSRQMFPQRQRVSGSDPSAYLRPRAVIPWLSPAAATTSAHRGAGRL